MSTTERCLYCRGVIEYEWSYYSGFRWVHTETGSEACCITVATPSSF